MNKKSNVPPLMQIFLEQQTAPRVQEARGKEWIEYYCRYDSRRKFYSRR